MDPQLMHDHSGHVLLEAWRVSRCKQVRKRSWLLDVLVMRVRPYRATFSMRSGTDEKIELLGGDEDDEEMDAVQS